MYSYMLQVVTECRIETAEWPNDLFQLNESWLLMSSSKFHHVACEL